MAPYSFAVANFTSIDQFTVSNFVVPAYTGGFNRDTFWDEFGSKNVAKDETELVTLLLDMSRCHWGPKVEQWPGMTVNLRYTNAGGANVNIVLDPGKSRVTKFDTGRGKVYTWTAACLATAAIFEQAFRATAGCDTSTINGHWIGCSNHMSTLDGFTADHQKNSDANMDAWITGIGTKKREAKVDAAIKKAVASTIGNRTKANSAYSLKNALKYLTGNGFEEGDQVSFTAP